MSPTVAFLVAAGHRRRRDQRGSAVIEAVIGVTAFGLFVALIVMAGRIALARQAVESAAYDAARTASIARSQAEASTAGSQAARISLRNQDLHCSATSVSLDTAGFTAPIGSTGQVTATVTCVVNLADLALPGVPGTQTITETMSSPVDAYRERTGGFTNPDVPPAGTNPGVVRR